jgi:hypothetical protein
MNRLLLILTATLALTLIATGGLFFRRQPLRQLPLPNKQAASILRKGPRLN